MIFSGARALDGIAERMIGFHNEALWCAVIGALICAWVLLGVKNLFRLNVLVVGALFAFSFSMLEVSDSLILAQKAEYFPITRAIYDLSQILGSGPFTACAFGVWTMVFLAATLAAAGAILGKKIGSVFRI